MLIPAALYGTYATAQREVRTVLARVRQGATWHDALAEAGTLDTAGLPGLVLLNGPNPLLGNDDHIHAFLPLTQLSRAISRGRLPAQSEEEVFQESLTTPDGVLGLLAPANQMWVYPAERHEPFLDAVRRFWPDLEREGARYSVGMATGAMLWDVQTNLKFVLARRGIDISVLNGPQPVGGIDTLIADPGPPPATS